MILRDRVYAKYRDTVDDIKLLMSYGFIRFIESKRYLKIRKRYLEFKADLIDPILDRRVNRLLQIDYNQDRNTKLWKTKSDRPEKKRKKRRNPSDEVPVEDKTKKR